MLNDLTSFAANFLASSILCKTDCAMKMVNETREKMESFALFPTTKIYRENFIGLTTMPLDLTPIAGNCTGQRLQVPTTTGQNVQIPLTTPSFVTMPLNITPIVTTGQVPVTTTTTTTGQVPIATTAALPIPTRQVIPIPSTVILPQMMDLTNVNPRNLMSLTPNVISLNNLGFLFLPQFEMQLNNSNV